MANELRVIGFAAGRALGKEKGGFASVMARAGGDADSAFRGGTRFPACEVGTNFPPVFMRSKAHATLIESACHARRPANRGAVLNHSVHSGKYSAFFSRRCVKFGPLARACVE
jgi:hypothetical protein